MTLRPCLDCGEPAPSTRCADCNPADTKPTAAARGYDAAWTRLSKRARRLQPFCLHCGATEDLQTDHTPEAWKRKAAGKVVRLQDIRVLCGPCNRAAGAARGPLTRGDTPSDRPPRPLGKAQGQMNMVVN